ncbi:hypothetical protein NL676_038525 [Syzygium grande]|nr:hypothetical protein NL676_038525 [Syzygium grande]
MGPHVTASYGDENMVKLLLQKGANKDICNKYSKTAYDLAAEHGHMKLFDALNAALHRTSFEGHIEVVKALLKKGIDINAKDEDGYTALHWAIQSGHMDAVELLVKKGANAEAMTNKGLSALQIAESLAYMGISRILKHGGRGGRRGGGRGDRRS